MSPSPHLKLGKLAIKEKDIQLARKHLRRTLTLGGAGPKAEEARRLLASLPND